MISCTEFIPAYSELFKYIHERGGREAVTRFWEDLSDRFLGNLASAVDREGLAGCWTYWSHTLNEEAADFRMTYDDERDIFSIRMRYCPSKGRLLREKHIEPYYDYCRHCDVLYRRVLEARGYRYYYDQSGCPQAQCHLVVCEPDAVLSNTDVSNASLNAN